jgi:hypothetical protein
MQLKRAHLLTTLLFIFFVPYVTRGETAPQVIGTLQLKQLQSGEKARKAIDRLHGKRLVFREAYIAHYEFGKKKASLWISVYDSKADAGKELVKMANGLNTGKGHVFKHFQTLSIREMSVYFVTGMGQAHYFFEKGKKVYWLAVDPSEARPVIRDLLEKIP